MRFSFILFLSLCLITTARASSASETSGKAILHETPQPLPPLTFEDAEGKKITLSDFEGHPVLLHFWATWCGPCVEELPGLARMAKEFNGQRGLVILPVSLDRDTAAVEAFYKAHKLDGLPIYRDATMRSFNLLKLRGLPATLMIDPEGREVSRKNGPEDWDSKDASMGLAMWLMSFVPPTPWPPTKR